MTGDGAAPRTDSRTVLVRMRAALPSLRPSERRIAQVFLDNPGDAANRSIAELAESCGTSTTSVVRFYQRMGYPHYKDLRIDLTKEATREKLANPHLSAASGDIDQDDTVDDVVSKVAFNETLSIADTARFLDRRALGTAIEHVRESRRVDIFGVGAATIVGLDLQQKLSRIGRTALHWQDWHAAWAAGTTLDDGCVAIGISHSGSTEATVRFLGHAAEAGARTVAITNHDGSPLADVADVVLTTAARETRFRSGALGSRIAQLMIVDCLFTGVAQSSYAESMPALRKTYHVVHKS